MRSSALRIFAVAVAAFAVVGAGCAEPPTPSMALPRGLELESLPAAQKALLRVTLEVDNASLAETEVVLDLEKFTVSGAFALQNVADGDRTATLRVYGRFAEESEEVILGRATDTFTMQEGATAGLDFEGAVFESCNLGVDGTCALEFDRNRNGTSNMLDLAPRTVEGGRGIDPGEQPIFINAAPETLQFTSGIRLGQFARQVIVLQNNGPNPIRFDSLDVGGGQGVALSLFDPFGGPVARPRRSLPAEDLTAIVEPGDEFLVAVSFAPVNAFLTTAGVQVVARDTVTDVVQATRVKVIANADGTLRPRPEDYVEPDIGATLTVGSGTVPVGAFPGEELFSGKEITTAGLVFQGATLVVPSEDAEGNATTFSMPADRGFVIDVPAATRLAVSLTELESDVDLALVGLNAQNEIVSVLGSSRHPSNGSEGLDFVNGDDVQRVVVVLGRVELDAPPAIPGGLALDEAAPFLLSCELSRGPEFSDFGAIDPVSGPLEGGTPFVLRGRGFQQGAVVTFADFTALDVAITVDEATGETLAVGLMPPGSLEVGKNPATAVVANPSIEAGGDGQAATLPEAFLYDPPAAHVDVVLPDVAPTTGATGDVVILGSFFTNKNGPPRVNFGDDVSVDATFVDSTKLTVPVSAHDAGTVVLTVQNQIDIGVYGANSNGVAFRFAEPEGPTPTITSLTPATGAADGGDTISVLGSGFVTGSRVLFGTNEASVVTALGDNISVVVPAVEFAGDVGVTVVNPDGQSANLPNAFRYFFPPPRIDGLLPTRVPTTGGTLVIVTGQSLRNGVVATFLHDTQVILPLSTARTSSTSVLVTTPPLPAGEVTLKLENPDHQSVTSAPLEVFEPQGVGPSIVFVDPASGPVQGQNLITIAGRDFDPDGVKVVLAGQTFLLPVEPGAAAGFDRVQFVAPAALSPGTQPIVLENGDGQSTVGSYLYVIVDVARIDQVLPKDLSFLPNNDVQLIGEFFSAFDTELQFFLGAGPNLQTLPLVARSDGLIIGRVTQRLSQPGLTPLSLSDGVRTLSAVVNVVVPTIDVADERGDEIEVIGAHLNGNRLHTFCAGADGYRINLADEDALVVRRDLTRDARCPATPAGPRPITLLYDGGAERFDVVGAVVGEEADADGDGVGVRDDANDAEPCVPNIIAAVCDFDKDGLTNANDADGQDPCVPSSNASTCGRDTDGDGVKDPLDGADADACVPNSDALTCTADADNDGVINPFDPQDADPCAPNPGSSACSRDSDNDGVTDAFDPVDNNACVPNTTATNCDADNDGVFPPADAQNENPCVPSNQHPLCTDDDDKDGVRNATDQNDADACVPNSEALTCTADADVDGVINPFDPADADPCNPNPASAACSRDVDGDGVTDAFDPVDNNACIPNGNALNCDADGDLVLPPTDTDNLDPCVPDRQDPLCTSDDDKDGTVNAADPDDVNACVPNAESLACTADADNDGVINPFDPADADPCTPNPASPACSADSDADGVTNVFDPVDNNPCVPNTTALNCDADGDLVLPPADTDNEDPCVPDAQDPLCTDDDDGDGVQNAVDGNDADACVPNSESLACTADADNDGVVNPFDSADANPCVPNPASAACVADADADGTTDAFDPVDNNPCVPLTTPSNCDADNDGVLPPTDAQNTDPCVPNRNSLVCTSDDDRDGTPNNTDTADNDACVPDNNALACAADPDGDGVANPFDPADNDPCAPNPAAATCSVDSDDDGVTDAFDPVDDDACVPDIDAVVCNADGDASPGGADPDNSDACVPDVNNALCGRDADGDGVANGVDTAPNDACVPNSQALTCTQDADVDGVANPFDPVDNDPCAPNPASAACVADADADGVTDPFDPIDNDKCVPNTGATGCDADGDGVAAPTDTANTDPCVPNANNARCEDDDDRDGVLNPADPADADPCNPNANALTCTQDADSDGVINPFDGADADGCVPNPASPACVVDTDGDGVTDPFDPVPNNKCVPLTTATGCDADGDGVAAPTDTNNNDPCVPNANNALCTNDDDRDGVLNPADPADADACNPNVNALTCTQDADSDGVLNPFDNADADPCVPNPASTACSADADGDGTTDVFDPNDANKCVPNANASGCDLDGDGTAKPADTNDNDVCVPSINAAGCDNDKDGVAAPTDTNNADACVPSVNNVACTKDTDSDGVTDFFDPDDNNKCVPNVNASGCDNDGDGTPKPADTNDNNVCVPNINASGCDADGDGVAAPADANNADGCVPNRNGSTCAADDDNDGVANPLDPDDADECTPNVNSAACDFDGDGVLPGLACSPAAPVNVEVYNGLFGTDFAHGSLTVLETLTPAATRTTTNFNLGQSGDQFALRFRSGFNAPESGNWTFTCDADDFCEVRIDGALIASRFQGGVVNLSAGVHAIDVRFAEHFGGEFLQVNAFGPSTTLAPIPSNVLVCGAADTDNFDACVPDRNDPLCDADDDGDGVINPTDTADNDACVPNRNAAACTADDDNDGVVNPADPDDANACVPNSSATACVQAPTLSLVSPDTVHALVTGDTLTVVGTRLNPVTTVAVVRVSDNSVTAATIVSKSDTSIVLRPNAVLQDSIDVASAYKVRVTAPAGTAEVGTFEAKKPRLQNGVDESAVDVGFNGEQLNPTRLADAQLRDAATATVVPLTVTSKSETFLGVHIDGTLVAGAKYQVELVYNLQGGGTTTFRAGTPRNCAVAEPQGDRFVHSGSTWIGQSCSDNAVTNGSFELDYNNWTVADVNTSGTAGVWGIATNGTVLNDGQTFFDFDRGVNQTLSCFAGQPMTVTATDGGKVSFLTVSGPDRHRAFQTVAIPVGATTITWDMAYNNTTNFDPTNQFIAINVRNASTDALLATLFKTTSGVDALSIPMTAFSANLSAFAGQTVRIELEVQIQNACMNSIFDDFRIF